MAGAAGSVVVIGAGIAGLGAAWELAQRGFDVTVLERAARPGGRAVSESQDGFSLDSGWPVLSGNDTRLLTWIDAVGLRDEMLPLRPLLASQVRGGTVGAVDPRGLMGVARIPGVKPHQALRLARLGRLLRRYGEAIDPDTPERADRFDDRSLADFGRLYFGESVLERWLAPNVTVSTLANADQASRVLFLHAQRRAAGARLGLPRQALGELAEAAASKLKTYSGAEAVQVEETSGAMRVAFRSAGESERVLEAGAVVLATAAADAARVAAPLLTAAERDFLGGVGYTAGLHVCAALRRPFSLHPELIAVPHAESSPLEAVLLEPGVPGGRVPAGHGLATLRATGAWSDAQLEAPDEAVEKELLGAFERFHSGASGAVLFTRLFRVARAHPRFDVGHYRTLASFLRVQADRRARGRRLYFAGDYLMHPSWEGALAAAQRAVLAIDADFQG